MESKRYKVIFNGTSVPSHDVERVKNNLASLFKTQPSQLDTLFQGKLIILKENLTLSDADAYREVVERIGGYCIIESMHEAAQNSVMNLATRQEKMACPRCRVVQSRNPVCRSCGTLIDEYRKKIATTSGSVQPNAPSTSRQESRDPAASAPARTDEPGQDGLGRNSG